MYLTEPVVFAFSTYVAFIFGIQYLFFTAFPRVFATAYGFNLGAQGLSFIGLGFGTVAATATVIFINKTIYLPKRARAGGKLAPEHRLYPLFIGGVCIPVALFFFGWTARPSVHWIAPIIAEGLYTFGNYLVFQGVTMYIMEFYGPLYGASAMGANAFVRYTAGAAFPLFSLQLFGLKGKGLGVGGASSLLGGIAILLAIIPWVFWWKGERLRSVTHFRHGA